MVEYKPLNSARLGSETRTCPGTNLFAIRCRSLDYKVDGDVNQTGFFGSGFVFSSPVLGDRWCL